MTIRLHTYPDGLTGLAAFCDVCGEQVTGGGHFTEDGYVVWKGRGENGQPVDALIVHKRRCDPGRANGYGMSMPLDAEIVYLANSVGVDLKDALNRARLFADLDELSEPTSVPRIHPPPRFDDDPTTPPRAAGRSTA